MDAIGSNIALFFDCENIGLAGRDVELVLQWAATRGRVLIRRGYADWSKHTTLHNEMHAAAIELIDMPGDLRGKNRADIRLVVDAMEVALTKPNIDTFIIASGDSDFVPLLNRIREYGRYAIVLSRRQNRSGHLSPACDELIYIDDVAPKTKTNATSQTTKDLAIAKQPSNEQSDNADPQPAANSSKLVSKKPTPNKSSSKQPSAKKPTILKPVIKQADRLPIPLIDRVYWAVRLLNEANCNVTQANTIQNELVVLFPKFRLKDYGISKTAGYRKLFTAMELEEYCELDFVDGDRSKSWKISFLDRFLNHKPRLPKPSTFDSRLEQKLTAKSRKLRPTVPNPHPLPSFAKPLVNTDCEDSDGNRDVLPFPANKDSKAVRQCYLEDWDLDEIPF